MKRDIDLIVEEQYFPAFNVIDDNTNAPMNYQERDKYLEILNNCLFIKENDGKIVKMKLTKKADILIFNGFVGYNNKFGGFSIEGIFDLIKQVITVNIYWTNTDEYETKIISINELNNKGKVI